MNDMLSKTFVGVALLLLGGFSVREGEALQCWECSSDIDRSCADIFNASDILRFGGGYYQAPYQSAYSQPYDHQYDRRPYDNRDNRDYRQRDYGAAGTRDPYFDRDRARSDPAYNRDPNLRDPYLDRDHRGDPYNRDYPPPAQAPRDYNNREYNAQGRAYDPNYPPVREGGFPRASAQASFSSSQSGPRLVTCNEEEARLSRKRNVCIKKVQRIGEYQVTYIRRCAMISHDREVGTCNDPLARGLSLDFCEYCEYDGCNSATGLKFNVFLASLATIVLFIVYFH